MEILKALAQSKLPSILLVGTFLTVGYFLIKGETLAFTPSLIFGSIFLILGLLLGVFSYSDHRNKEHTDKLLANYENLLKTQTAVLDSVSKTKVTFETRTQKEITDNVTATKLTSGYTAQSHGSETLDSKNINS